MRPARRAPLVVLHSVAWIEGLHGQTQELLERARKLAQIPESRRRGERRARGEKEKILRPRRDTLRELYGEAKSRGLKFGIEIREAVEELPVESDFKALLRSFPRRRFITGTMSATLRSRPTLVSLTMRNFWPTGDRWRLSHPRCEISRARSFRPAAATSICGAETLRETGAHQGLN